MRTTARMAIGAVTLLLAVADAAAAESETAVAPQTASATEATAATESAAPDIAPAVGKGSFTDPDDGAFDLSEWLLDRKGFLPVPILVTEPAIGYGGGIAALFFRESMREGAAAGRKSPPDIYGVGAAGTENGTRFAAAFGMNTFGDGLWRWRGGIGRPDINIDFYGAGGDLGNGDRKIAYNLEGWGSTQQLMRRIGESENYLGARWIWLDLSSRFAGQLPPGITPRDREATSSGVGLFFEHDSRDNFFTPSKGWKGFTEAIAYSPDFGSDRRFEMYRANAFGYLPAGEKFVIGGRVDWRAARGDVPFYQLPYIEMRGIPAARYQDENVALVEAELRWNITPRWALVGFGGSARSWGAKVDFGDADSASAYGGGVRRLIARRLGLYVGVDVARGPEETAYYIQVGSAWR